MNGPVAAVDVAGGASATVPMQFAFEVQQGSTRRIALSSSPASFTISRLADPERASILLTVGSIDFGGYRITDLLLNGELASD